MRESRVRTLVLYADYAPWVDQLGYYFDWRDAFRAHPALETDPIDLCAAAAQQQLIRRLPDCQLAVLLHCTSADTTEPLKRAAAILEGRRGKLVSFVGNEVSLAGSWLADKIALLKRVQPDLIASQLPQDTARHLYRELEGGSRILSVPHALNPEVYFPAVPLSARRVDIGTRSAAYQPFVGDRDRNSIVEFFAGPDLSSRLSVNIVSGNRFTRSGWAELLNSCRATVATEAGARFIEPDDRTVRAAVRYIDRTRSKGLQRPYNRLMDLRDRGPISWRIRQFLLWLIGSEERRRVYQALRRGGGGELATLEELEREVFSRFEHPVSGKAISSRHFEAIGTKTVQIMFPGRFNDILSADQHYIGLNRDFSNIDEVVRKVRDDRFVEEMTGRARDEILARHTHRHRIDALLAALGGG